MAGEIGKTVDWVKHHPYISAGGVFVIGAVLIYIYYSGGSSTAAAAPSSDPTQAELAAQVQLAQIGAQSSAAGDAASVATAQYADQLTAIQDQDQTALAEAQLGATTTQQANTLTAGIQQSGIAAQVQLASINAQTTDIQNADSTNYLEYGLTTQQSEAWDSTFATLYGQYLNNSSPTTVATGELIQSLATQNNVQGKSVG